MRISTAYQFESASNVVSSAQSRVFEAQRKVMTGRRIHAASDDPSGSMWVISKRGVRAASEQYLKNLHAAKGILGFSDSALQEANQVMRRGYELALAGSNGTTDEVGRQAMIAEVEQLQRRLVDVANSRGPSGEYLFAGHRNDAKPFAIGDAALNFNGDTQDRIVETGPSETLVVSTPGAPLFTDAYQRLEELKLNLIGGNTGAVTGSVEALQTSMREITNARGVAGVRMQEAERIATDHTRRIDDFTQGISDIEDVDISEAIMQYRLAETAYEAALSVAGAGFRLSLMDFMR